MKKILVIVVLLALTVGNVYAGGFAFLQWTPPTTYTDGSPIGPGELTGYRLYQGTASGTYSTYYSIPANTTQYRVTYGPTVQGTFYYALTAVTGSTEGNYSNEVSKQFFPNKASGCTLSIQ